MCTIQLQNCVGGDPSLVNNVPLQCTRTLDNSLADDAYTHCACMHMVKTTHQSIVQYMYLYMPAAYRALTVKMTWEWTVLSPHHFLTFSFLWPVLPKLYIIIM